MSFQIRMRNAYYVVMLLIFAYVGLVGRSFAGSSKYLPMIIGVVGVTIIALDAVTIAYGSRRRTTRNGATTSGADGADGHDVPASSSAAVSVTDIATEHTAAYFREVSIFMAWIAGYVALIALMGFTIATAAFLATYLRISAKWGILATGAGVAVTIGLLSALSRTFGIDWPDGVFSSL